ncbi:MAG TPA: glycerol-3-phosphate dehydrogenase [Clostridiales bacterium]|nr:glycerol-3-phosphate dehydrogenase [Clostridiales bacterium]
MKVSVLGCGRWGSFIAWYLSRTGHEVALWGRSGHASFETLYRNRKNEYVTFNDDVLITGDLKTAVTFGETVIVSIGAQSLRTFLPGVIECGLENRILCLCMKGVECDTGKRLSEVAIECGVNKDRIAVWVGPGHIQEFVKGHPNCMVIDAYSERLVKYLADSFRSDLIRFYYGDDVIGSEIGAAAKNVMGIAAGMLDGGGYTTLKGPLMARGAREVARLIKAMGGKELSAYGLCHLGDYETTLFSPYSNNRRYGEAFVKKEPFAKLAEGVATAKALKLLGEKYGVDLPITNAVCAILYDGKEPMKAFLSLFSRSARKEFI